MVNDVRTELHYDGQWNDITLDVRYDPPISIKWGRADEASKPSPSSMSLALNNGVSKVASTVTGRYSPRNPRSDLFGLIGRNTPIRVRLGPRNLSAEFVGSDGSYVDTPDTAALDITGDIDVRIDADPDPRFPLAGTNQILASRYVISGDQRSWIMYLWDDGKPRFAWSPDGTLGSRIVATSTAALPDVSGRIALRVTLDVNNGASGKDVKFYTSDTIDGVWTQLGATITTAGTTSVHGGTAALELGSGDGGRDPLLAGPTYRGKMYAFELYNGIAGTLVADLDLSAQEPEDITITDSVGLVWTLHGEVSIRDTSIRFSGEVTSWPPRWDLKGANVQVPVEASGIRRRLGQGEKPLRSALYRDFSTKDNVVAYWPLEDADGSTRFAPAVGINPMWHTGDVDLAAYDGFAGSEPVPTLQIGRVFANIAGYDDDPDQRALLLINVPSAGIPSEQAILYLHTTGTSKFWQVRLKPDGTLRVHATDADDPPNVLVDSTIGFALNGDQWIVSLWLSQVGGNVDWQVATFRVGESVAGTGGATLAGHTYGQFVHVRCGHPHSLSLGGMAVGHVAIMNGDVHGPLWASVGSSLVGWSGETAGDRIIRLADDAGIPLRVVGDMSDTAKLGPQSIDTVTSLLDEAAEADMGILTDDRDAVRLLYRARTDLYNQAAAVALDYAAGEVAPSLEPVEDDQLVRNDVTVKRPHGSEHQAVRTDGPMSIQAPPDGVGLYDTAPEVNVSSDGQLADQAGWRLHLGTVDEARYPQIAVDLTASPALTAAAAGVSPGDRVQVTNPPVWLPPDTIDQLAQGGTEQLTPHRHTIAYNVAPASPWAVAEVAPDAPAVIDPDDPNRADTGGSEIAAQFAAGTDTSMLVTTTAGPLWTTKADAFPFHVRTGGVVLNVTDIAGQIEDTFTRTEANGWGTADSGQAWTIQDGTAANFSTDGTDAAVSLGAVSDVHLITLGVNVADTDMTATVSTSAVATGGPILPALIARYQDTSNFYQLRANFATDGNVDLELIRVLGGAFATLATVTNVDTYAADELFRMRLQVAGNRFRAKIWKAAAAEPATWSIDVTNSDITAAGPIGTRNVLSGANTNTLPVVATWDAFESAVQTFAVDAEPVNGVTKTILAGSDIRLAQPAIVAL